MLRARSPARFAVEISFFILYIEMFVSFLIHFTTDIPIFLVRKVEIS